MTISSTACTAAAQTPPTRARSKSAAITSSSTSTSRTADLAALVGYTDYYLTEKFKKETGLSITNYVKFAKIERAKVLLAAGDDSIQSVAEALAFNTPNYFIQSFRDVVGCTPAQYRRQQQK